MRATLTLKDYYINKHLDTEADTHYYATIETDSAKISNNVKKNGILTKTLFLANICFFLLPNILISIYANPLMEKYSQRFKKVIWQNLVNSKMTKAYFYILEKIPPIPNG
ncbi:hypothetical protein [uncultured Helicobacter sp.]|uniref:hypothetical protein n=1 Tax=uncultured Helicobacter sp. TaxID=175537 RepID=UPI00261A8512|nr:hypothetical protein [uncultured Helicobacter sp.]